MKALRDKDQRPVVIRYYNSRRDTGRKHRKETQDTKRPLETTSQTIKDTATPTV
jgi:hypothetical protein